MSMSAIINDSFVRTHKCTHVHKQKERKAQARTHAHASTQSRNHAITHAIRAHDTNARAARRQRLTDRGASAHRKKNKKKKNEKESRTLATHLVQRQQRVGWKHVSLLVRAATVQHSGLQVPAHRQSKQQPCHGHSASAFGQLLPSCRLHRRRLDRALTRHTYIHTCQLIPSLTHSLSHCSFIHAFIPFFVSFHSFIHPSIHPLWSAIQSCRVNNLLLARRCLQRLDTDNVALAEHLPAIPFTTQQHEAHATRRATDNYHHKSHKACTHNVTVCS